MTQIKLEFKFDDEIVGYGLANTQGGKLNITQLRVKRPYRRGTVVGSTIFDTGTGDSWGLCSATDCEQASIKYYSDKPSDFEIED